jgi:DNA-binding CsgD family transcriptional regulator
MQLRLDLRTFVLYNGNMLIPPFLQRFFRQFLPARRSFRFEAPLLQSLEDLAKREQRPPQEIASRLLEQALREQKADELRMQRWSTLSPREQEIAALVCLNYTNPQIAARLVISPETVKTHVRNILFKFDARSKQELRQVLSQWDFSSWSKK